MALDNRSAVIKLLKRNGLLTSGRIADKLGITRAVASYHLQNLRKEGVIESLGRGVNGGYRYNWEADTNPALELAEGDFETIKNLQSSIDETEAILNDPETLAAIIDGTRDLPRLEELLNATSPFAKEIAVPVELFGTLKNLSFPVGIAAVALLSNDVQTAKRMLELV